MELVTDYSPAFCGFLVALRRSPRKAQGPSSDGIAIEYPRAYASWSNLGNATGSLATEYDSFGPKADRVWQSPRSRPKGQVRWSGSTTNYAGEGVHELDADDAPPDDAYELPVSWTTNGAYSFSHVFLV